MSNPPQPLPSLPPQPTTFVGRAEELAAVAQRLADPACRLLTLVGPGGVGKTRLAIEAAVRQQQLGRYRDGVAFVPLSAVTRAQDVPQAIAAAIADELYLAVSTVKWHAGQIFAKLTVRRRTEAVARARELGLLS